jgi:hypothetical protein
MMHSESPVHLGFTPDGPKGPRRRVQVGMIYIASRTGLPIVPCGYGFTHAWKLSSWDRFTIPRPFSRIVGVVCEPIHIPAELDRNELERWRIRVEEAFLKATADAEDWARRIRRDGMNAPPPVITQPPALRAAA